MLSYEYASGTERGEALACAKRCRFVHLVESKELIAMSFIIYNLEKCHFLCVLGSGNSFLPLSAPCFRMTAFFQPIDSNTLVGENAVIHLFMTQL